MSKVHHGSATTTAALRRAIQHSHVWAAPAHQGLVVGAVKVAGAVMSSACCGGGEGPLALMVSAAPVA